MRTRTALFLCLYAMAGMLLAGLFDRLMPPAARVWMGAAATLLFFGAPAALGLCVLDGDQRALLMTRKLSSGQTLWLCASGVLLVCPATLLFDILGSLASLFGVQAAALQGAEGTALLLPLLLASGVIAPLCEELFFRGYLMGVFARRGAAQAAFVTALLFAAAHGLGLNTPVYLLLGLLFAAALLHTGSVLAPLMLHMGYNAALILLSATPLSAFFVGLTPSACMARLLGCAALCYTVRRAWLARGVREGRAQPFALAERDAALLIAVLLLTIAAQAVCMLTAGGNG